MSRLFRLIVSFILLATLNLNHVVAEGNPYYGGWGNCTWGTWQLVHDTLGVSLPEWGHAGSWIWSAQASGYPVGNVPTPNSIGVYSNHVVFVDGVSEDGLMHIQEGGFQGGYSQSWTSVGSRHGQQLLGFIYLYDAPQDLNPIAVSDDTPSANEHLVDVTSEPNREPEIILARSNDLTFDQSGNVLEDVVFFDTVTEPAKSDETPDEVKMVEGSFHRDKPNQSVCD